MRNFPYPPRKYQMDIVKDVENILNKRGHLLLEAPTGIGKTISVLGPSIEYAIENGLKVFYLTRTNSQQEQVIKESRELRKFYDFTLAPIQGRNNYCFMLKKGKINYTAEELAQACRKRKEDVKNGRYDSCPYYANLIKNGKNAVYAAFNEIMTAQDFMDLCAENEICAYESMKYLASLADVLVMPYIYFFDPFIRSGLLEWSSTPLEKIILIVDEAHNLPDFARELRSERLSLHSLSLVDREIKDFGDFNHSGLKLSDFVEYFRESMIKIGNEILGKNEDSIISGRLLMDDLIESTGLMEREIDEFIEGMVEFGEKVRLERINREEIPRSHIGNLGEFLRRFFYSEEKDIARIISRSNRLSLEIFSLDARPITSIVENVYSSIHMSGTLKPLDEYESMVFTESRPEKRTYPSIFPKDNLKVYYIDSVTTKYENIEFGDDEVKRIAVIIDRIIRLGFNTLVLFPSYRVLKKVMDQEFTYNGYFYIERQDISQSEFIRDLHLFKHHGGVFFSVFGGRMGEGMDFPGGEIQVVVIVGIPYPKPDTRQRMLEKYYLQEMPRDRVYRYLVHGPAGRKMVQAIGRMIRSENDRGVAVILDSRATRFREYIDMEKSKDIEGEIKKFWEIASLK
ncbi:MAG: ATP-dependent DNA helicase [Thermoplasmata archaeon]